MDPLPSSWFQELEMDEPFFTHHWEMSSLSQSSQQLASASGEDIRQYSSLEGCTVSPFVFYSEGSCSSIFGCTSMEALVLSSADGVRKFDKSISLNSCTMKPDLAGNNSSPTMLQFKSLDLPETNIVGRKVKSKDERDALSFLTSQNNEDIMREEPKTVDRGARPTQAQDHIIAERKRREKLNLLFIELSAIVPGLKKMDKASVLSAAFNYVKDLQEKVKCLEGQNGKRTTNSGDIIQRFRLVNDDNSSSRDNFKQCLISKPLPEIEVKLCEMTVHIGIHCENHKGVMGKVLSEIEKLNLSVTNASIQSFPISSLHINIAAQTEEGFSLTAEDLVKKVSSAIDQFI